MINQQLINQLLINLLIAGLQVSKLVLSTVVLSPMDQQFTLHQVGPLSFGWIWKSMKFQWISNTLKIIKIASQDLQKSPKWGPIRYLKSPNSGKSQKKWNLMKTPLFIILLIGWDIINQQDFHSKVIKIHGCTPNMFSDASNLRKYQKVIQTGVQRGIQNPSKIIENPLWDLPGSLCVHRWPTWLQNCAKMVPKDFQMDPKWSPGDPKRS